MNYKILLMGLLAASLTSCSTYKAGQTPDDVYYSPAREVTAKKETKKQDKYEDYTRNEDDRFLRMKVRNRDRWSIIDDYGYWYDSRYDHCSCNYNYYNTYGWNNWHRPYYSPFWTPNYYAGYGYGYGRPGYPVYISKNPTVLPSNVNRPPLKGYNNNNTYSTFGNNIKNVFSNSNSNSSYNNSNSNSGRTSEPSRTYNPSSSGSSSSGSSSSSSGGAVSRPPRNGGN